METIIIICNLLIQAIALKALVIGSDYSFYYRIKYGKEYAKWYKRRDTFQDYLDRK
jgi:hypothetical protein